MTNRAAAAWGDLDIFRAPKPYISFGLGIHVCLGMCLARLEMRVALETSLPVLFGTPSR